jgi:hypothetical protein
MISNAFNSAPRSQYKPVKTKTKNKTCLCIGHAGRCSGYHHDYSRASGMFFSSTGIDDADMCTTQRTTEASAVSDQTARTRRRLGVRLIYSCAGTFFVYYASSNGDQIIQTGSPRLHSDIGSIPGLNYGTNSAPKIDSYSKPLYVKY